MLETAVQQLPLFAMTLETSLEIKKLTRLAAVIILHLGKTILDFKKKLFFVLQSCAVGAIAPLEQKINPITDEDIAVMLPKVRIELKQSQYLAATKVGATIAGVAGICWWFNRERQCSQVQDKGLQNNKYTFQNRVRKCFWIFVSIPIFSALNNLFSLATPQAIFNLWPTRKRLLLDSLKKLCLKVAILSEFIRLSEQDFVKNKSDLTYFLKATKQSLVSLLAAIMLMREYASDAREELLLLQNVVDKIVQNFNSLLSQHQEGDSMSTGHPFFLSCRNLQYK